MTKRITPYIKAPSWYPLEVYRKELSAIEWLNEICKRYWLNNHLTPLMNPQQQEALFLQVIVHNKIIPASNGLRKLNARAIRPLSVFEVLNMANQIRHSDAFKMHENKNAIEEILDTLAKEQPLSIAQKKIVETFLDIPWHNDIKPHLQVQYRNGVPVTIDTGIYRDETLTELRNFLTRLQGKKLWPLSPEIFKAWERKGILPIFDLQVWFKIKQVNYKKTDLWHIIYSENPPESPINEDETVDEKAFINAAIKDSVRVIQTGTIRTLWMYCEAEMLRSSHKT